MEPRKGAQGHMGREKTKEEDDVFSHSPFPLSSVLQLFARCRVLHKDDWGRVRYGPCDKDNYQFTSRAVT